MERKYVIPKMSSTWSSSFVCGVDDRTVAKSTGQPFSGPWWRDRRVAAYAKTWLHNWIFALNPTSRRKVYPLILTFPPRCRCTFPGSASCTRAFQRYLLLSYLTTDLDQNPPITNRPNPIFFPPPPSPHSPTFQRPPPPPKPQTWPTPPPPSPPPPNSTPSPT